MFLNKVWLRRYLCRIHAPVIFLTIAWILGIFIGFYAANGTNHFVIELPQHSRTLFGLLFVILLPFLFSVLSMRYLTPLLFIPLAFADAFIFAYCSYCIQFSFGNAGWLFRWLLMFSDSCMSVTLLLFWVRNIDQTYHSRKDLGIFFIISCLIGFIDYFAVSPFLSELLLH